MSLRSACTFVVTWLYPVAPGQSAAPPPWIEEVGEGSEERQQAGLAGGGGHTRHDELCLGPGCATPCLLLEGWSQCELSR